jgi:hypothetical protein
VLLYICVVVSPVPSEPSPKFQSHSPGLALSNEKPFGVFEQLVNVTVCPTLTFVELAVKHAVSCFSQPVNAIILTREIAIQIIFFCYHSPKVGNKLNAAKTF